MTLFDRVLCALLCALIGFSVTLHAIEVVGEWRRRRARRAFVAEREAMLTILEREISRSRRARFIRH